MSDMLPFLLERFLSSHGDVLFSLHRWWMMFWDAPSSGNAWHDYLHGWRIMEIFLLRHLDFLCLASRPKLSNTNATCPPTPAVQVINMPISVVQYETSMRWVRLFGRQFKVTGVGNCHIVTYCDTICHTSFVSVVVNSDQYFCILVSGHSVACLTCLTPVHKCKKIRFVYRTMCHRCYMRSSYSDNSKIDEFRQKVICWCLYSSIWPSLP
jgi:hypothetical protein